MDAAYTTLEIGLHRWDTDHYVVEMRLNDPQSEADIRLTRGEAALVQFDLGHLQRLTTDPAGYGRTLSASLFANPNVQNLYIQARSRLPLRLQVLVGASAPELHGLRWETLHDPTEGHVLATSQRVLFSRYLSSIDWRRIKRRAKASLRLLMVVANPVDLSDFRPEGRSLAPIDVAGEVARVREIADSLSLETTVLASGGSATLNNISTHLRDGYDMLYMVNHGALINGQPHLWLEDEQGHSQVVPGRTLVKRMQELLNLPTLVVLASCQSAGSGAESHSDDGGVLAALGPLLAEAGVPSVVAMQGNITLHTVAGLMPVFFHELQRDGQIDRAMAAARGAVRERPDWWVPVLFMRLKNGRIWYEPGFAEERPGFERWPALVRHIQRKRSTPVLGPGLFAPVLGSTREIARRWAESFRFPLEPHQQDDLPQVAQYLAVHQGEPFFPHEELQDYLHREVVRHYGDDIPHQMRSASFDRLAEIVGALHRNRTPSEPHRVLARLPFPVYITTNPDSLLKYALLAEGKEPQVVFCPWNSTMERQPALYQYEREPTIECPLVYQLFGSIDHPETLVLTEDDYFDYLIGFTSNRELIPDVVRRALADTSLLFLGFRLDDWNFKVLFRSIMSQEGGRRRKGYTHVAVQIDPEDEQVLYPEGARRYLHSYFEDADISIYWGSVEDFMKEMHARMTEGGLTR